MRTNIELKARLTSIENARRIAESVAGAPVDDMHQVDTYYRVHNGRLKMRVINDQRAELIWYFRDDVRDSKSSRYQIVDLDDWQALQQTLAGANGVACQVVKRRQLFLYKNVRIHLDQVEQLGDFLEFEAVLKSPDEPDEGHQLIVGLRQEFDLPDEQLICGSYSDMIRDCKPKSGA